MGRLFFELDRSNTVTKEDMQPGQEEALVSKIQDRLGELQQGNQGNSGFAQIAHVISDYLAVDEEAQAKIARYLLLVEGPLQTMQSRSSLLMIPPSERAGYAVGWIKTSEATLQGVGAKGEVPKSVSLYADMSGVFDAQLADGKATGDPEAFNKKVAELKDWLSEQGFTSEISKGSKEHFFNTFAPFARAQGIYVIALLLACFSWGRLPPKCI